MFILTCSNRIASRKSRRRKELVKRASVDDGSGDENVVCDERSAQRSISPAVAVANATAAAAPQIEPLNDDDDAISKSEDSAKFVAPVPFDQWYNGGVDLEFKDLIFEPKSYPEDVKDSVETVKTLTLLESASAATAEEENNSSFDSAFDNFTATIVDPIHGNSQG